MRQSPYKELDGGEVEPSLGAGDRRLEVFGEAAVAVEPGKGPFDDPAAREELKTDGVGHARHDLDRPVAEFGEGIEQLVTRIGAVAEEMSQPRKEIVNGGDDEHRRGLACRPDALRLRPTGRLCR